VFRTKIEGQEEQEKYLTLLLGRAIHTRSISVTPDDRIILLTTCSSASTNGRDILVGKISENLYDDPFKTEELDKGPKNILAVDGLPGLWERAPLWVKIAAVALSLLLLLLALSLIIKNKQRKRSHKLYYKGVKRRWL
jgi:sortase B